VPAISIFDMFKVGVGPSSSHTLGPWRAAQSFLRVLRDRGAFDRVTAVRIDLYGSLAKTGIGHGTDLAVVAGLAGEDPETCDTSLLTQRFLAIRAAKTFRLDGVRPIAFDPATDLLFHRRIALPFHPNGLTFTAFVGGETVASETYYSIGGGFVTQEGEQPSGSAAVTLPFPIDRASDLERYCADRARSISDVVYQNERTWRTPEAIDAGIDRLWQTMRDCMWRGCYRDGILPGGLNVVRRAAKMNAALLGEAAILGSESPEEWIERIRKTDRGFQNVIRWVSAFALGVNEENAPFGRVVTAPTNGAAGVIPAVLMYYVAFHDADAAAIRRFMLTAGEVGSLFKKGATISAAMGGCQAEIGVSSSMAAAGLCECLGGSAAQAMMAAEIAMEHHLGLTCDPVGGLVQVPCIERNTMGAIKAITASSLALTSDPTKARVSLDAVIRSMWATALDMSDKYKETSEGGLAIQLSVNLSEC